jgi:uncharacterized protein YcbK (DUF882 family)
VPIRIAREHSLIVTFGRAGRVAGLAAALLLIANNSLQTAVAEGDTRTISFHHVHTGEDITITYKRDGRYDDAALAKLNWFMRDWRKDEQTTMDPHLFDLLWETNREVGGTKPIQVICGYRSPDTNAMLRARSSGVAQFSMHTHGDAMDFFIPDVPLEKIREVGLRMQRGGVGFYPTSGSPFVHLDTGAIRHWPRMTHDQLVKVFPDGRTVHVPSDGHPLAGYALALADVERRGNEPNEVSLAAARNAGVIGEEERTASLQTDQQPKRGFFASLFGSRDEPAETAKPQQRVAVASARVIAPLPVSLEHIVPVPKGRPVAVASLTPTPRSRPIAVAALGNNVFADRGMWNGGVTAQAKPVEVASAGPFTTASVPASDQPLAYAADVAPQTPRRAKVIGTPMGAALPRATTVASADAVEPDHGDSADAVSGGGHFEGPWLRAMLLTPSASQMTTTRLGALDPRPFAEFMHKPASTLSMAFAADPQFGMRTGSFSGSAVVFLATATFGTQRTASLR